MPVACDLYLPEDWAHDRKRRLHAGVPSHLTFRTKIEMAIDQTRHAVAAGLPRGIVLADAAYGGARSFRDALRDLALSYALGIESNTTVVPAATADPATGRTKFVKVQAGAGPGGGPGPPRGAPPRRPRPARGGAAPPA